MEQEEIVFYHLPGSVEVLGAREMKGDKPLGAPLEKLIAKEADPALGEKHVPVITHEGGKLVAKCGTIPHPMIPTHYILWMALVSGNTVQYAYFKPEGEAKASWPDVTHGAVYAYCNLHGLWKKTF